MSKPRYRTSLFIFRRDLRLADNTALNAALQSSQRVLACFVFDPRQIEAHPYRSQPALQFMLESLNDLQTQCLAHGGRLYLFGERPEAVVELLHRQQSIEAVFVNRDYTPFSRQRDRELELCCEKLGIGFHSHADLLLNEPERVLTDKGLPYQVFTAFHKKAVQNPVAAAEGLASGRFYKAVVDADRPELLKSLSQPQQNALAGGRQAALQHLAALAACRDYSQTRDFPELDTTSHLSPYLKFGCCSVREAYQAIQVQLGPDHALLRQLYWRDFFSHIAYHFPHVFGHAFDRRLDGLRWRNAQDDFWAWANGQTGFPIVDAAMRELNQTGWMHNRLRMVAASFLVKDLHVSWRWGERYFAQHLLDYDPCVNNGNWQWAASTGCDAQPYFRIFNPWLQQKKFDPDCRYIKTWLPELQGYSAKAIHNWEKAPVAGDYPPPRVNHAEQSRSIKAQYQTLLSNQPT
ncbi:deoxyribodipyrimidine photo-lyase [Methylomonas sp. DH-1]|uniref:cryptochrome/photolyase family protein n=1 Tax=Methylomonas sp. (strain DH-1) TaxID=1727196 RepID=UPI0007C8E1A7|nr:deoxyribodipyrimidine photo-lyase [Methylomonas sp. DH-1]ANE55699.1 deoxyribodipyrimidine photolyase [Methylomonas sp. DH-1]